MMIREALIGTRLKIKRGWCRRNLALDEKGLPVSPTHPKAVKWCLAGALQCVCEGASHLHYARALLFLESRIGGNCITTFNDSLSTSQSDVLNLLDKAIEDCHE